MRRIDKFKIIAVIMAGLIQVCSVSAFAETADVAYEDSGEASEITAEDTDYPVEADEDYNIDNPADNAADDSSSADSDTKTGEDEEITLKSALIGSKAMLAESAYLLSAPYDSAVIMGTLPAGSAVEVTGEEKSYYEVKCGDYSGFVLKSKLSEGNATVSIDINLRDAASFESNIIEIIPATERVIVLDTSDEGWIYAKDLQGQEGYLKAEYVTVAAEQLLTDSQDAYATVNKAFTDKKNKAHKVGETVSFEDFNKKYSDFAAYFISGNAYIISSGVYTATDYTTAYFAVGDRVDVTQEGDTYDFISCKGHSYYVEKNSVRINKSVKSSDKETGKLSDTFKFDGVLIKEALNSDKVLRIANTGDEYTVVSENKKGVKVESCGVVGFVEPWATGADTQPFFTDSAVSIMRDKSAESVFDTIPENSVGQILGDYDGYYLVSVSGLLGYVQSDSVNKGNALICVNMAEIYSKPNASSELAGTLNLRSSVTAEKAENGFYKITSDSVSGYTEELNVWIFGSGNEFTARVISKLNSNTKLYESADSSSKKLKDLKKGDKVSINQVVGEFTQVEFDGKTGYIESSLIKIGSSAVTTQSVSLFSTEWEYLGYINGETDIQIISDLNDNWAEIYYNGKIGYVLSCYTKRTDPNEYSWARVDGWLRAFDMYGNIVCNVSGLVDDTYLAVVYKWDNTVVLYTYDENGDYTIPVRIMVCSAGETTPTGLFYTLGVARWLKMEGNTYAQWCTCIVDNYLFHSVPDWTYNNMDLEVYEYNMLGTTRSLGCVRLQSCDSAFFFDNIMPNLPVQITDESCPFAQPTHITIDSSHTWDPTDREAYAANCLLRGCH